MYTGNLGYCTSKQSSTVLYGIVDQWQRCSLTTVVCDSGRGRMGPNGLRYFKYSLYSEPCGSAHK